MRKLAKEAIIESFLVINSQLNWKITYKTILSFQASFPLEKSPKKGSGTLITNRDISNYAKGLWKR